MRKPITTHFCVCADGGLLRAESPTLPPRAAVGTTLERRKIQNRTDIMNHLRCKLSAPLSKAILGLPFTAHQHAAPWGEPRPAVQKRILKLKPGSPCCFCVYSCRHWCRSSTVGGDDLLAELHLAHPHPR